MVEEILESHMCKTQEVEPSQIELGQLCWAGVEILMAGQLVEIEQGRQFRTGHHLSRHCVAEEEHTK